jgi:hypothetical protein
MGSLAMDLHVTIFNIDPCFSQTIVFIDFISGQAFIEICLIRM